MGRRALVSCGQVAAQVFGDLDQLGDLCRRHGQVEVAVDQAVAPLGGLAELGCFGGGDVAGVGQELDDAGWGLGLHGFRGLEAAGDGFECCPGEQQRAFRFCREDGADVL